MRDLTHGTDSFRVLIRGDTARFIEDDFRFSQDSAAYIASTADTLARRVSEFQLFPASRLKNPSRSNSSRVLSSRYLLTFGSSLLAGFFCATISNVLCKPPNDTRVGKENRLAKYW